MKLGRAVGTLLLALLPTVGAGAATLNVSASAVPDGALFDYSYKFTIAGSGVTLDNLFLGSDDLSPLNVVLQLDGSTAANWSWLGNNVPQNYLQFFSTNGSTLSSLDTFAVSFKSALSPSAGQFAIGLNSTTGVTSNAVTGVVGPSSSATPEPSSWLLMGAGSAVGVLALKRRRVCAA